MPTYDYRCGGCNHEFEQFQSITSGPTRKCPKCGKLKLKRLIGAGAGLIFKGSGFYITDYRSDGYKQSAKSDSGTASSPTPAAKDAAPAKTGSDKPAAPAPAPAPAPAAPAAKPASTKSGK